MSSSTNPEQLTIVDDSISRLRDLEGALLPIFHDVQERLGFVPPEAIDRIANGLNLSRADVHGVLTYYHDFRTTPPGRHVMKLCRAEACQAVGCNELEARLEERHGVAMHATTGDGSLTVEPVYCLGNCALGPSLLLDGKLLGRVSPERLDAIVAGCGGDA